MLYYTRLDFTVLYWILSGTILCDAVPYYTILCHAVLYYAELYYAVCYAMLSPVLLCSPLLYPTLLYSTLLHPTTLLRNEGELDRQWCQHHSISTEQVDDRLLPQPYCSAARYFCKAPLHPPSSMIDQNRIGNRTKCKIIPCCKVDYRGIQHNTIQYHTVWYNIVYHIIAWCNLL